MTDEEFSRHPSPEEIMLREAIDRLSPKRKKIWELYAYDRRTHDEIGKEFGVSHQAITKQIRVIEKRIKKWVDSNRHVYELLKEGAAHE